MSDTLNIPREILETVLDHLGEVIWMSDVKKNKIIYISKGYERVWEQSCEELLNRPMSFVERIHPEDQSKVIEAFSKQVQGQYAETYRLVLPSGQIKWIFDKAYPIRSNEGEVTAVVGIASDITEKVRAEESLKSQQSQMAASSRLSALGQMAGGIAHEINNPLAIIEGKASYLLDAITNKKATDEMLSSGIQKISETVFRINKIIKGLKTFARSGDQEPFVMTSIEKVILETLDLCRERFKNGGVDLLVSEKDWVNVQVHCRPVQICQVLLNLLNNSYDAVVGAPQSWVKVTCAQSAELCLIKVIDSGNGIPPDVASKLMEPFFTTKSVGKGTGLGLSISKGIIEEHGGYLWYDDTEENTTFAFVLNVKK